jgi:hypothetical protein
MKRGHVGEIIASKTLNEYADVPRRMIDDRCGSVCHLPASTKVCVNVPFPKANMVSAVQWNEGLSRSPQPWMKRTVVAIDPAISVGENSDGDGDPEDVD